MCKAFCRLKSSPQFYEGVKRSSEEPLPSEKHFPFCERTPSPVLPFPPSRTPVDKRGLAANGRGLAGEWLTPGEQRGR